MSRKKQDEIIARQAELIRTLTANNLRRMSQDFWGGDLTPPEDILNGIHLPDTEGRQTGGPAHTPDNPPGEVGEEAAGGQAAETAAGEEAPPESIADLKAELDSYIGLERVKEEVKSLINMVTVSKLRAEHGLPTVDMSLHMVFSGNPGTGKTMIARLMARIYKALGILSKGQLVEVDRSGLVAGFVGQTAGKTAEVLQKALGGVLFIDEAYALINKGDNDFGSEAVDTLLKYMEDHREDLVVIAAGYDGLMQTFIHSNPGLESRFNRFLHFEDYSVDEMMDIFEMQCKKGGYRLAEDARESLRARLEAESRDPVGFGNARGVRNLFEDVLVCQNNRLAALEAVTREDLMTLTKTDVEGAEGEA